MLISRSKSWSCPHLHCHGTLRRHRKSVFTANPPPSYQHYPKFSSRPSMRCPSSSFLAYPGFYISPLRVCSILRWVRIGRGWSSLSTERSIWGKKEVTSVMYFGRFSYRREYILYFLNKYLGLSSRPMLKAATVSIKPLWVTLTWFQVRCNNFRFNYLDQKRLHMHDWRCISPAVSEPKIKTTTHPVGDSCFRVSISVNCTACPPPLVLKTSPWKPKAVKVVKVQSLGQYDSYSTGFTWKLTTVISLQVSSQLAYVHKYTLPHCISYLLLLNTGQ